MRFDAADGAQPERKPIGIYDSGVGGLSVLERLVTLFPNEDFVYLGDTVNMPYGGRTPESLHPLILQNVEWLKVQHQVKFIVLACNTARSALTYLVEVPLVIHPAARDNLLGPIAPLCRWLAAQENALTTRVGVIATPTTVSSNLYPDVLHSFLPEMSVKQVATQTLARRIESGELSGVALERDLQALLAPLLDWQMDTLILGCTHYPHALQAFQRVLPASVALLDPALFMARSLEEHLTVQNLKTTATSPGTLKFYVTQAADDFQAVADKLKLKNVRVCDVQCVDTAC